MIGAFDYCPKRVFRKCSLGGEGGTCEGRCFILGILFELCRKNNGTGLPSHISNSKMPLATGSGFFGFVGTTR